MTFTVDRIYIRKGKGEFDSVTFRVDFKLRAKRVLKGRFWAKLDDVNRLLFEHEADAPEPLDLPVVQLDF